MKLKYIKALVFIALFVPNNTHACDACGCAISGGYFGILPQYKRNLIGMRYSHQMFKHPTENGITGSDYFNSTDFHGRWYPGKRIQAIGVIPYHFRNRVENGTKTNIFGIGDIRFLASYFIFNSGDSAKFAWKNTLQVGSGIKLPTGKYMQRDKNLAMLPMGLQPGNGAWALPLTILHSIRHKNWGVTTDAQYWLNGKNELSYQTGNFVGLSSKAFYWRNFKKWNILASLGLTYWKFNKDSEYSKKVESTGGEIIKMQSGIDVFNRRWAFHLMFQPPIKQNIPQSQPSIKTDFQLGFSWFL